MKAPTCVSVVEQAMKACDDFITPRRLVELTGLTSHQVQSSLHHLRRHKAADAMMQDNDTWWYLTTSTDDRVRKMKKREQEQIGSRKPKGSRRPRVLDTALDRPQ